LLCAGLLHNAPASAQVIEVAAGSYSNFDADHRNAFGNAPALSIAYSAPYRTQSTRIAVELGYVWNSGPALWRSDPTFESGETRYWLVPLLFGLRTNLVKGESSSGFGLALGLGIQALLTGFEGPLGTHDTAATVGTMVEIRPQVRIDRSVALWLSWRLNAFPEVAYQAWDMRVNYSAASLHLGLALGGH
jgi:hypothetical protein